MELHYHHVCLLLMIASVACIKMTPSHHFKTYEGLKYDTTILDRQHQIIKRSKPSANAIISLSFTALNRSFTLELWPSKDVFADNPQFLVHTNTSTMISSDYDMSSFYRGRLKGHSLSRVYGHIIDGIFDGEVMTGDGVHYHVEHVKNYHIENDPLVHSIIYSNYDIIRHPLKESLCGVKDELINKLLSLQSTAASASRNYSYPNQKRLHKKSVNRGSYCQIFVAVDHLFLANVAGNSEVDAIREVVAVFASSQTIFLTTDFDSDGSPDFITPQLVKTEVLTSDSYNGIFASNDIPVEEFLDKWSQIDHTSYCLSLLLTYRDFANGILGLAWIAQPSGGSRGGVCEGRVLLSVGERSLNTAIVSYLNYGSRQPRSIMSITVTHEFGHNFGSSHDPITDDCSPGGTDGNYLMYSRATDGALPNNRLFSPCSISSINTVLQSKSSCFKSAGSFCGNLIREGDESCDCGDDVNCIMTDPCCSPTQCVLKPTASCSALDECCDNCRIDVSGRVCRVETECANSSSCNRISSLCPRPASKDKPCNNGTRYCMNGECIGSVCLTKGWEECQCNSTSTDNELCHVCCSVDGSSCTSTFTLHSIGMLEVPGQYRDSGRSCSGFTGYCSNDIPPICVGVDNEQTLKDLLNIFTIDTLNSFVAWLKEYWWILLIGVVIVIIIIVLLHLTYRKKKINKSKKKTITTTTNNNNNRRRTSGNDRRTSSANREMMNERREREREKLQKLKEFFPSCDVEVIMQVRKAQRSDSKTIEKLLALGFTMKRLPLPS